MGTIIERNNRFLARVRVHGFKPYCKTFGTYTEAQSWLTENEDRLRRIRAESKKSGIMLASSEEARLYDAPEVFSLPRIDPDASAIGVYFLFKNGRCVYVGQSLHVHVRVTSHRVKRNGNKEFDCYSWIPVPKERLDEVELYYISLLNPELNDKGSEIAKLERRIERAARIEKPKLEEKLQFLRSRRNSLNKVVT